MALLSWTAAGLYCPAGGFHIDPQRAVERAVITHGHADHARPGCGHYLSCEAGAAILRLRLGAGIALTGLRYGQRLRLGAVTLSLHPAGHILGSAQVRIEHRGEVWGVTGDFKTEADLTCTPFEPLRCHTLVIESTFALPLFRWQPQAELFAEINTWWMENRRAGRASILQAYTLGKAQRVLAGLDAGIGPVAAHGAVEAVNRLYRAAGVRLPAATAPENLHRQARREALVLMPPRLPWSDRFPGAACAMASGWMLLARQRRMRGMTRGFALSDHADWQGLTATIAVSGAERIWTHHGYAEPLARWCREKGLAALHLPLRDGSDTP